MWLPRVCTAQLQGLPFIFTVMLVPSILILSFFLITVLYSIISQYWFNQYSSHGPLGHFQYFAILKSAALNNLVISFSLHIYQGIHGITHLLVVELLQQRECTFVILKDNCKIVYDRFGHTLFLWALLLGLHISTGSRFTWLAPLFCLLHQSHIVQMKEIFLLASDLGSNPCTAACLVGDLMSLSLRFLFCKRAVELLREL